MSPTIFGRIIAGEIPVIKLLENDDLIAIRDINPMAPIHLLVIPKKPLQDLASSSSEDEGLLGKLLGAAREVAAKEGLDKSGYRLVINNGEGAGQSVPHLHIHVLGGREFQWPPG